MEPAYASLDDLQIPAPPAGTESDDPVLSFFESDPPLVPPRPHGDGPGRPAYNRAVYSGIPAYSPIDAHGGPGRASVYSQVPDDLMAARQAPPLPFGGGAAPAAAAMPPMPVFGGHGGGAAAAAAAAPGLRTLQPGYFMSDLANNVKYLHALHERARYRVTLGAQVRRRDDEGPFDTEAVFSHFRKNRRENPGSGKAGLAHADPGRAKKGAAAGQPLTLGRDWVYGSLIWVCTTEPGSDAPVFYSHVCKVHRFHHSTFAAGGGVIGAGEWIVTKGKLLKISGNSGHYKPTMSHLHNAVLHMAAAFHADTTVLLYDTQADAWVDVPVGEFVRSPAGGGRYWVHPDAKP
ncbi:MAG TPA: hypothetical protein VFS08_15035 [Gemmatimonadaceae bacterium]|nr:hypothetical protein [Gemmatimonadaceae bacterium]